MADFATALDRESNAARTSVRAAWPRRAAPRWLDKLARFGYASRGTIYLLIGSLALLGALGGRTQFANSQGALVGLLHKPGGWLIVLTLGLGLFGYAAWRFCQSVLDADQLGARPGGLVIRSGLLIGAVAHLALGIWAVAAAAGLAEASESNQSREMLLVWVMSYPLGDWLVGLVGAVVVAVGIAQFFRCYTEKFARLFRWDPVTRSRLMPLCKFGLAARGIVFGIVGCFILYAAWHVDPQQAGGMSEALHWVRSQEYGFYLFLGVAAGLFSFGIFGWLEAIYRGIPDPRY